MARNEWIPCDMEMPECYIFDLSSCRYYSEELFVTFLCYQDGKPTTADCTALYCDDGKWYWGNYEDGIDEELLVKVTAWMPKPEPYNGVIESERCGSCKRHVTIAHSYDNEIELVCDNNDIHR